MMSREQLYPLGAQIRLEELERDPNPIYARLRREEPVSWVPAAGMWFVTRFEDVAAVLRASDTFTVADPNSLLSRVFGPQILSIDGSAHREQRQDLNPHFTPAVLRDRMTRSIETRVARLIDGLPCGATVDLRPAFASRLPVQVILDFFGFPPSLESDMRSWYDSFEQGLANLERDPEVEARAKANVAAFRAMFAGCAGDADANAFMATLLRGLLPLDQSASNALTIFFGGISTVEALILNSLWVLCDDPALQQRVRADRALTRPLLEEVMRWASPVQSSARMATRAVTIGGTMIASGDRVSCMLGAANRDPQAWPDPDRFDIDRPNLSRHLGFSMGSHFCLGSHLARLEARIAISALLDAVPLLRFAPGPRPQIEGCEFRQPRSLAVSID
ncbi:cytochrome P450 [Rhizorhabdus wittichii DC-6]|nr:cytochrome P450 [Rhizorhabdus wittichii DC-6]